MRPGGESPTVAAASESNPVPSQRPQQGSRNQRWRPASRAKNRDQASVPIQDDRDSRPPEPLGNLRRRQLGLSKSPWWCNPPFHESSPLPASSILPDLHLVVFRPRIESNRSGFHVTG